MRRNLFMAGLLMMAGLSVCFLPAYAAEYYVSSTTGVDNGTCDSENPCAEVAYVSNTLMQGGDTLYIAGEFSESIGSSFVSGTAEGYTQYKQWPDQEQAVFNYDGNLLNLNGKGYIRFEGLAFTFDGTTTATDAVTVIGSNYIEFAANIIHDVGQNGIAIAPNSTYITIEGNTIYNTGLSGTGSALKVVGTDVTIAANLLNNNPTNITVQGGDSVIIKNNFVYSSTQGEINVQGSADDLEIYNNTFFTDANQVINFSDTFSGVGFTAKNNIFYSTSDIGVIIYYNTSTEGIAAFAHDYNYNLYYLPNSSSGIFGYLGGGYSLVNWQALGYDANSSDVDPKIVSTESGAEDLHISGESPAIDAGTDLTESGVTTDYDGETRPYASAYDIGADETANVNKVSDFIESAITNASATISWTDPGSAVTEYVLEYSVNEDMSDSATVEDIAETSYDLTGLTANTTYYYMVKAVYTTEYKSYESGWMTDSVLTAPDAPTALAASNKTSTSIDVSWTAPSGTIASYVLAYATDENFTENANRLEGLTVASQTVENLTANTTYYFVVLANNGTSDSAYSEILETRTFPIKVNGVKVPAKFKQAHQVKVKWNSAGDDLKYQVKLMNKKGKKIKIYKTSKLNKVIKKLKADKIYKVRVRAKFDADNKGAWSKIVKFRTLAE